MCNINWFDSFFLLSDSLLFSRFFWRHFFFLLSASSHVFIVMFLCGKVEGEALLELPFFFFGCCTICASRIPLNRTVRVLTIFIAGLLGLEDGCQENYCTKKESWRIQLRKGFETHEWETCFSG